MANIDTLQKTARHVIVAGDIIPGLIREVGAVPASDFKEALSKAIEIVGKDPDILVLPGYYREPKPIFEVT